MLTPVLRRPKFFDSAIITYVVVLASHISDSDDEICDVQTCQVLYPTGAEAGRAVARVCLKLNGKWRETLVLKTKEMLTFCKSFLHVLV